MSDDTPTVMDLIKAYADLVSHLSENYVFHDQRVIDAIDAEITRIEDDLHIEWRDGRPVMTQVFCTCHG